MGDLARKWNSALPFLNKLRNCRQQEDKADALANDLLHKDTKKFWRNVNSINNKKIPLASCVGRATGPQQIALM